MGDLENDLHAISEDIAADAADLAEIEQEKARLEPENPRMLTLAKEAERLARRIVPKTVSEVDLATEAAGGNPA